MYSLIFYTKLNCHLCEEAYQVLLEIINDIPMKIYVVDITRSHHESMMAIYGNRIPVIAKPEAKSELDWPFTVEDLRAYLAN